MTRPAFCSRRRSRSNSLGEQPDLGAVRRRPGGRRGRCSRRWHAAAGRWPMVGGHAPSRRAGRRHGAGHAPGGVLGCGCSPAESPGSGLGARPAGSPRAAACDWTMSRKKSGRSTATVSASGRPVRGWSNRTVTMMAVSPGASRSCRADRGGGQPHLQVERCSGCAGAAPAAGSRGRPGLRVRRAPGPGALAGDEQACQVAGQVGRGHGGAGAVGCPQALDRRRPGSPGARPSACAGLSGIGAGRERARRR